MAYQDVSMQSDTNRVHEKAYLIKHVLQLELRKSRALHVLDSAKVLGHTLAIFFPHRLHLLLAKLLAHLRVVAQICLSANNEARHARAVVVDLGEPLFSDVLKTGR
jgi:hypothetical protein